MCIYIKETYSIIRANKILFPYISLIFSSFIFISVVFLLGFCWHIYFVLGFRLISFLWFLCTLI